MDQEQTQMGLVKGGASYYAKDRSTFYFENEIIKILLLYGNEQVEFIEEVINVDEEGREQLNTKV